MPLRLGCPCIRPVEGQRPHEYISRTDHWDEIERGELMIASESGNTWLAYWRLWWAPWVAVPSHVKESQPMLCGVGSPLDWKRQTLDRENAIQFLRSCKHSWVSTQLKTNPKLLEVKRMDFYWLYWLGFSVMKSVHSLTVMQWEILFPRLE